MARQIYISNNSETVFLFFQHLDQNLAFVFLMIAILSLNGVIAKKINLKHIKDLNENPENENVAEK